MLLPGEREDERERERWTSGRQAVKGPSKLAMIVSNDNVMKGEADFTRSEVAKPSQDPLKLQSLQL